MRVSLNLSEEMLERVDQEARRLGTSRGAMLTAWVGEKIASLDMSRQLTEEVQKSLVDNIQEMMNNAIQNPQFVKAVADSTNQGKRKERKK